MAIYTQRVTLDVSKELPPPTIRIGQGDKSGTQLVATILNDGQPFSLTGYSVKFAMRLPHKGGYYEVGGTVSGNTATFTIDESVAASVAGLTDVAYVEVMSGSTVICSTSRMNVVVKQGAYDGVDPANVYDNGVLAFLEQAREDLDDAIDDAAETAASHQAVAIAAKVPWPVVNSSASHGTSGQVLVTNGDGTTTWKLVDTAQLADGSVTLGKLGGTVLGSSQIDALFA